MEKLTWDEIREPAKTLFDIWVDSPELDWAEESWCYLEADGQTQYKNEYEKWQVALNLLCLGCIYHEFCSMAFDEHQEIEYKIYDWLASLKAIGISFEDLTLNEISSNLAFNANSNSDIYQDDEELAPDMLTEAAQLRLKFIEKSLAKGFGSVENLFLSLCNSNGRDEDNKARTLEDVSFSDAGQAYTYAESLFRHKS